MKVHKSVCQLIDEIIQLIPDCLGNSSCRSRLNRIKDDTFLELPEDRNNLLHKVGQIINDSVPDGKDCNNRIHDYWYDIRKLWDAEVFSVLEK